MLGQSTSLTKFKTIEIIQDMSSNNKEIKLEVNTRKKTGNFTKMWKLNNNTLKTTNGSNKKSQGKSENTYKLMNMETQHEKLTDSGKAVLKVKFMDIKFWLKKKKKSQISNLTFHVKTPEEKIAN